jgi:hypothetical protein
MALLVKIGRSGREMFVTFRRTKKAYGGMGTGRKGEGNKPPPPPPPPSHKHKAYFVLRGTRKWDVT